MKLEMRPQLGLTYKSPLQIVRVVSEDWAARNLYCPACTSHKLNEAPTNTRAIDLSCPKCNQVFQLKTGRHWNQRKIVDAAYAPMITAIRSDRVPNLFIMQYTNSWRVQNLLLIPFFFFTEKIIERRRPLSSTARRSGWVGCNILLREIPPDGKLSIVENGLVADTSKVRSRFRQVHGLSYLKVEARGWTVDVLRVVRRLGKPEFTISEIYAFEAEFAAAYPGNRNIRPKIRQQLQKLRDLKFLEFVSPGRYRALESN